MEIAEEDDPFKDQQIYRYIVNNTHTYCAPSMVWRFLQHIIKSRKLPIRPILNELIDEEPFFLVAATGLGKTVIVPLWLLFRHMHYEHLRPTLADPVHYIAAESPRVWVVEPKIAICQSLETDMNHEWTTWFARNFRGAMTPMFGCKTKTDQVNMQAPILFLTTGMFAIYARKGIFKARRDIILIDEAHETLEADEAMELGVGICNMNGVDVNYMSATIDVSDIPEKLHARIVQAPGQRQCIWRHNTAVPMEECIIEIVRNALVEQRVDSVYFPQKNADHSDEIIRSVTEADRAKGMLIIVNSFASEHSDAKRIERLLRQAFSEDRVEIGLVASEILRDPKKRRSYTDMLERWKTEKKRYVLIATSVVEMGVTLPDLDFIVTMDSGFGDMADGGLKHEALGVNSLIQRIGRVGRQRPGIAYITREIGAPYADLDDESLNAPEALVPEPIHFPLNQGRLTGLAYYTFEQGWPTTKIEHVLEHSLRLPSYDKEDVEWLDRLYQERERLIRLGIATDQPIALTPIGIFMERWIDRADLHYAMIAQRAFEGDETMLFVALCWCAFFAAPWEHICPPQDNDYDINKNRAKEIPNALIHLVFIIMSIEQGHCFTSTYAKQEIAEHVMEFLMQKNGSWNGFLQFTIAVAEALEIFHDANRSNAQRLALLYWIKKYREGLLSFSLPL